VKKGEQRFAPLTAAVLVFELSSDYPIVLRCW
jgi:H+/Cl- antiporter ClcA